MHRAVWPAASAGEFGAVDRALRISESYRRLCGIDLRAPEADHGQQVIVITGRPWENITLPKEVEDAGEEAPATALLPPGK